MIEFEVKTRTIDREWSRRWDDDPSYTLTDFALTTENVKKLVLDLEAKLGISRVVALDLDEGDVLRELIKDYLATKSAYHGGDVLMQEYRKRKLLSGILEQLGEE